MTRASVIRSMQLAGFMLITLAPLFGAMIVLKAGPQRYGWPIILGCPALGVLMRFGSKAMEREPVRSEA